MNLFATFIAIVYGQRSNDLSRKLCSLQIPYKAVTYSFFPSTISEWNKLDRRYNNLQLCCLSEMPY